MYAEIIVIIEEGTSKGIPCVRAKNDSSEIPDHSRAKSEYEIWRDLNDLSPTS